MLERGKRRLKCAKAMMPGTRACALRGRAGQALGQNRPNAWFSFFLSNYFEFIQRIQEWFHNS
jgi:hypothetical protein